jgi:hypothetical protein
VEVLFVDCATLVALSQEGTARLLSQFYAQVVGGEGGYLRRCRLPVGAIGVTTRLAREAIAIGNSSGSIIGHAHFEGESML